MIMAHQAAITETATVTERRDNARRQLEALADELAAARTTADDDLLAARKGTAESALAQAQATLATADADLAAADVEAGQLALERAETAEREVPPRSHESGSGTSRPARRVAGGGARTA